MERCFRISFVDLLDVATALNRAAPLCSAAAVLGRCSAPRPEAELSCFNDDSRGNEGAWQLHSSQFWRRLPPRRVPAAACTTFVRLQRFCGSLRNTPITWSCHNANLGIRARFVVRFVYHMLLVIGHARPGVYQRPDSLSCFDTKSPFGTDGWAFVAGQAPVGAID